jgi:hypothetical protein
MVVSDAQIIEIVHVAIETQSYSMWNRKVILDLYWRDGEVWMDIPPSQWSISKNFKTMQKFYPELAPLFLQLSHESEKSIENALEKIDELTKVIRKMYFQDPDYSMKELKANVSKEFYALIKAYLKKYPVQNPSHMFPIPETYFRSRSRSRSPLTTKKPSRSRSRSRSPLTTKKPSRSRSRSRSPLTTKKHSRSRIRIRSRSTEATADKIPAWEKYTKKAEQMVQKLKSELNSSMDELKKMKAKVEEKQNELRKHEARVAKGKAKLQKLKAK